MRLLASIGFAAALTFSAAAQAQPSSTSPTMADARCLLAMVALSNADDPNQQRMGQGGAIYFMGRIAGRDPNFDFATLRSMATTLDLKTAQADLQQRCGPMFNKSMQQVGDALAPPAGANAPPSGGASPPGKQ